MAIKLDTVPSMGLAGAVELTGRQQKIETREQQKCLKIWLNRI